MSELTGSTHRCHAQFKCVQTVVGQRFDGNGPNGLSYYYYYYYYYINHFYRIDDRDDELSQSNVGRKRQLLSLSLLFI